MSTKITLAGESYGEDEECDIHIQRNIEEQMEFKPDEGTVELRWRHSGILVEIDIPATLFLEAARKLERSGQ